MQIAMIDSASSSFNRLFRGYHPLHGVYDELFSHNGGFHENIESVCQLLTEVSRNKFKICQKIATSDFKRNGVTFTVYSNPLDTEKIFPFDLIPRIIDAADWQRIERGLKQRLTALNLFLKDIYTDQHILKSKVIPHAIFQQSPGYEKKLHGFIPANGAFIQIAGIDLVRNQKGEYLVLEDNLRTPSGVSYVLENRFIMKRLFPHIFSAAHVKPVDEYPLQLKKQLTSLIEDKVSEPNIVVLTPGYYNSAYFEHCFLAKCMGCDLVRGQDLFVHDDKVYLKTTQGPRPIHIIYRRIDDAFLDPSFFRQDSLLGVKGLVSAYLKGNVILANAIGNGIADDKALYPYVPEMIKFYLSEEPILKQIKTYHCSNNLSYILNNIKKLVIKESNGSGGYGMLVGATATQAEINQFKTLLRAHPEKYIAQPIVELSTCPTFDGENFGPRRVDLRPFIITGKQQWVLPGGLTRVALMEGSYVVNSSQGGGSKDTWVLESNV